MLQAEADIKEVLRSKLLDISYEDILQRIAEETKSAKDILDGFNELLKEQ